MMAVQCIEVDQITSFDTSAFFQTPKPLCARRATSLAVVSGLDEIVLQHIDGRVPTHPLARALKAALKSAEPFFWQRTRLPLYQEFFGE